MSLSDLNELIRYPELNKAHLRYDSIQPIIDELKHTGMMTHRVAGYSFEKRPINLFTVGTGNLVIFAWSQMHGDEATATASLLDLLRIVHDMTQTDEGNQSPFALDKNFLTRITLHVLPMLNPDGAELMIRHNAQSIDINRDAVALQSPEGRLLRELIEQLKPSIAFNLHDQSPYYQCGTTGNPATIAFLAPAFDAQKSVDLPRQRAMALIGHLSESISRYIPNKVARYDDTFSARSFGDCIAGFGASTVLIESGAHPDDPNRQIARALNTFALLHTINMFCDSNEQQAISLSQRYEDAYWQIPENKKDRLCSLLIKNVSFANGAYEADVSVIQTARYSNMFVVNEIGDLSVLGALAYFDASSFSYQSGNPYILRNKLVLNSVLYLGLLSQGYSHFVGDESLLIVQTDYDVLLNPRFYHSNRALRLSAPAFGLFEQSGQIKHALLNGKILSL